MFRSFQRSRINIIKIECFLRFENNHVSLSISIELIVWIVLFVLHVKRTHYDLVFKLESAPFRDAANVSCGFLKGTERLLSW